jgi:integrase
MIPLRGMLADAHADGLIERNPMDRVRNLTVRTEEPAPFTPDERNAILAACVEPQNRHLFQFAFWTGLRTSELIALEWQDVDWRRGVVRVRRASVRKHVKPPKTRAGERDVMLLPPALEALQAQRPYSELKGGRCFVLVQRKTDN